MLDHFEVPYSIRTLIDVVVDAELFSASEMYYLSMEYTTNYGPLAGHIVERAFNARREDPDTYSRACKLMNAFNNVGNPQ